jgi:hypothetical protein
VDPNVVVLRGVELPFFSDVVHLRSHWSRSQRSSRYDKKLGRVVARRGWATPGPRRDQVRRRGIIRRTSRHPAKSIRDENLSRAEHDRLFTTFAMRRWRRASRAATMGLAPGKVTSRPVLAPRDKRSHRRVPFRQRARRPRSRGGPPSDERTRSSHRPPLDANGPPRAPFRWHGRDQRPLYRRACEAIHRPALRPSHLVYRSAGTCYGFVCFDWRALRRSGGARQLRCWEPNTPRCRGC